MAEGSVNAQKALFKPIAKVVASGNQKVVITLKTRQDIFFSTWVGGMQ